MFGFQMEGYKAIVTALAQPFENWKFCLVFVETPNIKLPLLPQGDVDQLYLEVHSRTWQFGNTTMPFYDWINHIGVDKAMIENHLN